MNRLTDLINRLVSALLGLILVTATGTAVSVERVTYYHNDALGSPVAATDASGLLLWREGYRPYGERTRREAGSEDTVWFTGKPEETAFGLQYFGARWYAPKLGRFVAMDPVGFTPDNVASFSKYAYANNNPYAYIDPDGRESVVSGNMIYIRPENKSIPAVTPIPNTVGASGFSAGLTHHQYHFMTQSNLGLSAGGSGIANNPTPGIDRPASSTGTLNNVGAIGWFPGPNNVRSFLVPSPDPQKYSDITVNYTVNGQHTLNEGFVMRWSDTAGTLHTYGEGNAVKQKLPGAEGAARGTWKKVDREVINNASQ